MRAGKILEPSDATDFTVLKSGDILYYDTTAPAGWKRLPIGTVGQVLKTDSGKPKWVAP